MLCAYISNINNKKIAFELFSTDAFRQVFSETFKFCLCFENSITFSQHKPNR